LIFGADSFVQEDYKNFKSIGLEEKEILSHPNKKVREWTT
jgi:hypothetical protein